jgi:hypothetical protein
VAAWVEALDRPWERAGSGFGSVRVCRLPDGLGDPAFTADDLDQWCTQHASESIRSLAEHYGTTERMVSANLPAHTDDTRIDLVLRRNLHLHARESAGEDVTAEWADQQQRQQAVYDTVEARYRRGLEAWNHRDAEQQT